MVESCVEQLCKVCWAEALEARPDVETAKDVARWLKRCFKMKEFFCCSLMFVF